MPDQHAARKLLGAWYTPPELVGVLVAGVLDGFVPPTGRPVRVLDPACGDGRLLAAVGRGLADRDVAAELYGYDLDRAAVDALREASAGGTANVHAFHDDALARDWGTECFDIVVGNPPFLSQLAATTTRGGASRHGGGPYADAAAEFLALAIRLADPAHGRVAMVLPQSILGARDAGPIREAVGLAADLRWSWWAPRQRHFDAAVNVCVIGFERPARDLHQRIWTSVVTGRLGIPELDGGRLHTSGTIGDRCEMNANFRDEYYALVPAVDDTADGPPLVTSGLIDPGRCWWGERPVTFARRRFEAPRVDLGLLSGRFVGWAQRKLVPKVLVANQTRVIEAVADPSGEWLPGVPITTAIPTDGSTDPVHVAAALTSPVASALAWHAAAGTGLSGTTMRVGPALLAALPWPAGDLAPAADALGAGDVVGCGRAATTAYGFVGDDADELMRWWCGLLPA